jgi:hypothetical protein
VEAPRAAAPGGGCCGQRLVVSGMAAIGKQSRGQHGGAGGVGCDQAMARR